jgi:hypothetical protein
MAAKASSEMVDPLPRSLLRQPNFAALLALVWLLVALALLLRYWVQTADTLLDTDDAMRLVQMRDWLAGQGWTGVLGLSVQGGVMSGRGQARRTDQVLAAQRAPPI